MYVNIMEEPNLSSEVSINLNIGKTKVVRFI